MQYSPRRRWFALLALALGGFGIGVTEFVSMGLLPNIAQDLLPTLYASNSADANATAGHLISAYALGVVVGAPTIAAAAARWPRKRLLTVLVACFVIGNLATAILPSFGWVLVARFVSGLPHGAYFGIASLVAATLMGPGMRARGVAFVLSGLTIANVIGVPIGTYLGQNFGWRSAFWLVTVIFAATLVAILATVPFQAGNPESTIRNELRAFSRPQIWLTLAMASIGFGGMFAVYSYVAPVVTDVTGLGAGVVPLVLVTFGVGMTIGNFIGGWAADKSVTRSLLLFMPGIGLACLAFGLTAASVPGLFISIFFIGAFVSAASPTIQARLMDVAHDSQSIAAALNHSALNLGNSLGAFLGGIVIAAGFGYIAPAWVGIGLSIAGVSILLVSLGLDRRAARRS
ncbi:arabinose ABC transporter permease [Agreia sp. Leaf335]|uniref:MFS transporter n=1 Tax=Agreia sp. Leaf335 TaxID=1736340 RepID=UPI0006FF8BAE|nr:MFS transporter [Agreia sp. Leaf335]KQR20786.1 arabinose ABC transporter permease [Agreia sp. Leaf335]